MKLPCRNFDIKQKNTSAEKKKPDRGKMSPPKQNFFVE